MRDPRTLLQRLHGPPGWRPEGRDGAIRALAASVRDNLEDLLTTRQGAAAADPTYGLPDLGGLVAGLDRPLADTEQDGVRRVRDRIAEAIRTHEPRLRLLRVQAASDPGDPFAIRFELEGELLHEGHPVAPWRLVAALRDQRLQVLH
ncbi:MAG: type VI secretion system baseplate subunit TssE [Alphaproteobacteria bacterium]|nr:type VI secretion system baseplate subunit TssE [Alphaproteobacteria bacterium]